MLALPEWNSQKLSRSLIVGMAGAAMCLFAPAAANAGGPFASRWVSFDAGATPTPGYPDPAAVLGSPERFTGEGSPFPGVVSLFNPAWGADELVSIGEGGHLTVEFATPITNDASHRFGVDLLIFGNGGLVDAAWPDGRIGDPATFFGLDAMQVAVSADGVHFVELGEFTEGLFPAQGYRDSGPYDDHPGRIPTDFTRPVNPALTPADFAGLTLAEALALYDGSGGGTPIDIGAANLEQVRFVRIRVPDDGNPETSLNVEIDALSRVPEPAGAVSVLALLLLGRRGGRA